MAFVVVILALVAGVVVLRWSRIQAPPVPLPAGIAALDPQVRDHLAGIVRSIEQAPGDPLRRAELGLAFAVNDLWIEARQSFLDAQRLGDKDPHASLYAAIALQELGDLPGSIVELRELTGRHRRFAPGWHRLGTAWIAAGEPLLAAVAFDKGTQLAPGEWRTWAGLGEARLRAGQIVEAIQPLERAIALDPFARTARHILAQAFWAAGRGTDAARESAAGRSQSTGPMPDAWSAKALGHMKLLPDQFERADTLAASGRAGEAVALLREALRFHPTNTVVVCRLARAMCAGGQAPGAWELLAPLLARVPVDSALLIAAAETTAALGRPDDALELAKRAVAQAPNIASAHVAQANALLAAGKDAEAASALEVAIRLAPADVGLQLQLGDLQWHNLQRPDMAIDPYLRAREIDPIHPVALERLAALRIERGEMGEAERLTGELRRLGVNPRLSSGMEGRPGRDSKVP